LVNVFDGQKIQARAQIANSGFNKCGLIFLYFVSCIFFSFVLADNEACFYPALLKAAKR
jgi:hypothetical protein